MDESFDPRKNVLQGILKGAREGLAGNLKQKYGTPNLEQNAVQPVPGAEGVDGADAAPEGDDLEAMLSHMVQQ